MAEVRCPRCASLDTAEIHYGAESREEQKKEQVIRYGGIHVVTEMEGYAERGWGPRFHCHECSRNFGATSLRSGVRTDAGTYREAARRLLFETGGHMQGFFTLTLEKSGKGCFMKVSPGFEPEPGSGKIEKGRVRISEAQFDEVMRMLFEELFVLDWKEAYEIPHVMDGHQWRLDITMEDGGELSYRGLNGYPVYWDRALELFDPRSILRIGDAGKA